MSDRIYIQFAENGNIRKWQREPFEGGTAYLSASIPAGLDAVDMDMIQRGDMLGHELGARGWRLVGPDEVDPAEGLVVCPDCDGQKLMHGYDCDCPRCAATGVVPLETAIRSILDDDDADVFEKLDDIRRALASGGKQ